MGYILDLRKSLGHQPLILTGAGAAIINDKANKTWNVKNVRFGWIDFIDDIEVNRQM